MASHRRWSQVGDKFAHATWPVKTGVSVLKVQVVVQRFARGRMSKYAQSIPAIPVLALVLYQQAGSATCLQSGLEYY